MGVGYSLVNDVRYARLVSAMKEQIPKKIVLHLGFYQVTIVDYPDLDSMQGQRGSGTCPFNKRLEGVFCFFRYRIYTSRPHIKL